MEPTFNLMVDMQTHKFLILLIYFERPNIVLNAIKSLNEIDYDNYEIMVIDDGSREPFPFDKFNEKNAKKFVKFYQIKDSIEDKESQGGSRHGMAMNMAIKESSADLVMILCDDDGVYPTALKDVDQWFVDNPNEQYGYGHLSGYNPMLQTIDPNIFTPVLNLNRHTGPIAPSCQLDSSQVVYKRKAFIDNNLSYPEIAMGALDAHIYSLLFDVLGPCKFMNCIVQYKGVFDHQMGSRSNIFQTGDN